MTDAPGLFFSTIFAKTIRGQQEIQSRSLGLAPLVRRVLVLVDGHRSSQDLAAFVPGDGIENHLAQLLSHGCIEPTATAQHAPAAPAASPRPDTHAHPLAALPAPETRSAKELEMARNFMTNTVNNIFGHHNRISLLESIFACQSSGELRQVYPAWAQALESNATSKKRLPELRDKLFAVL